ncbi:conserved phage C-terminal domain-containing protein [Loigolactobacillus zhaoyuanensis]|uniref:Conserved phage C-terminal domain-containing protein n=1 Tax=Loigolactobacillus zhaoyuanensis TaxID=2486017 RepID=A0ABW8U901_9LACO
MHIKLQVDLNYYQQKEFQKLADSTTGTQYKNALALWSVLLKRAAELNQQGLIYQQPEQPLTQTVLCAWLRSKRRDSVSRSLRTLIACGLVRATATKQYRICNWSPNFVVLNGATPDSAAAHLLQDYNQPQRKQIKKATEQLLIYLNQVAEKAFAADEETQLLVAELYQHKATTAQIKRVIDWKTRQWKDDIKMRPFLRPQTLFGPKFNTYLNEVPASSKPQPAVARTRQAYLYELYAVSATVDEVVAKAAADQIVTTKKEVEAVIHEYRN